MSHVSPDFIPVFGDCIRMIRQASMSLRVQFRLMSPQSSRVRSFCSAVLDLWIWDSWVGSSGLQSD
jgi:hypothetical protein